MTKKITPFLWFNDNAEEAMELYVSIFEDAEILSVSRYGEAGPGTPGSVMTASFRPAGQEFTALNGGPMFTFTEAVSFVIDRGDQAEVDYYWDALTAGGEPSARGWLKDRFGLSWRVVPRALPELLGEPDPEEAGRVMGAMLRMGKIEIAEPRRAYEAG